MFSRISRSIRAALLERIGVRVPGRRLPASAAAGRFPTSSFTNGAGTRAYKTWVPARGAGEGRPLVVMLHGCKQDPDDFAAGTRMNQLADELGFIVVYPEQARAANRQGCWNWFRAENQQRDAGEPSIIAGITREVIARYKVDEKRVYVAGLSAGGAMAAVMGRTYPDLYAAVGVHSGLPYGAAQDITSALAAMRGRVAPAVASPAIPAVPTIVFHGDDDTTVHPDNGHALARAAPDAQVKTETGEERGRKYTRIVQADASGKPALEHWVVHGAGHAWSGGSRLGSYADPQGPDATRAMLRFFL